MVFQGYPCPLPCLRHMRNVCNCPEQDLTQSWGKSKQRKKNNQITSTVRMQSDILVIRRTLKGNPGRDGSQYPHTNNPPAKNISLLISEPINTASDNPLAHSCCTCCTSSAPMTKNHFHASLPSILCRSLEVIVRSVLTRIK